MSQFQFDGWDFDAELYQATFRYSLIEPSITFSETVIFAKNKNAINHAILERAMTLAHYLIGTSYAKTFPTPTVRIAEPLDQWQADFLTYIYQEGMSQYAYENELKRANLAHFSATSLSVEKALSYGGRGVIALQSGGKDSLLLGELLNNEAVEFDSLYITSTDEYPSVIDHLNKPVRLIRRQLDHQALNEARLQGGLNGHVPVTYIVLAISLIQAVLDNKNIILAAIGHEGEEPHAYIDDLAVTHQWSKTLKAEQLFSQYVKRYVSPSITVGSPLRQYSELEITRLFSEIAWTKHARQFSSCNVSNYQQGQSNESLRWCGNCPKCANSYLLFAAWLPPLELKLIFEKDLFTDSSLQSTFKGLLGIDDFMKPFECIGEIDELRFAYHAALARGHEPLGFTVPPSAFNPKLTYPSEITLQSILRRIHTNGKSAGS